MDLGRTNGSNVKLCRVKCVRHMLDIGNSQDTSILHVILKCGVVCHIMTMSVCQCMCDIAMDT